MEESMSVWPSAVPEHPLLSGRHGELVQVRISTEPFQFDAGQLALYEATRQTESFRFIDWHTLTENDLTLPIDRIVVGLMKRGDIVVA